MLFDRNDLADVKKDIQEKVGKRVLITAKKGRKTKIMCKGSVLSVFASVFVVKLDVSEDQVPSDRRMSFSYTDILTKSVEIVCIENSEKVDTAV